MQLFNFIYSMDVAWHGFFFVEFFFRNTFVNSLLFCLRKYAITNNVESAVFYFVFVLNRIKQNEIKNLKKKQRRKHFCIRFRFSSLALVLFFSLSL